MIARNVSRLAQLSFFGFVAALAFSPDIACAQPEEDAAVAKKRANDELRDLLDNTNNLFYKASKDDNGNPFYTIVWEDGGESTRIIMSVKELGHYNNKYVHSIMAWTYVIESDSPLPPAAIKAVATESDSLLVGNFSCSSDFTKVYANMTGVLTDAKPGAIWMYCAYLHSNRLDLREKIEQSMSGTSSK